MEELLFECYRTPSLLLGVDALYSQFCNLPNDPNCLIVSFGHHTCNIIPLINGSILPEAALRINLGGFNLTLYLQRVLQLKCPKYSQLMTFTKCENIVQSYCRFAKTYESEILSWNDENFYTKNTVQLKLGNLSDKPAVVSSENFSLICQRLLMKVEENLTKRREKNVIFSTFLNIQIYTKAFFLSLLK